MMRMVMDTIFQSTPPARGATKVWDYLSQAAQFQSTPPARGATQGILAALPVLIISIHAPREGGDKAGVKLLGALIISIHAPREGGDCRVSAVFWAAFHFNPRPPRGGRQQRCTVLPADL